MTARGDGTCGDCRRQMRPAQIKSAERPGTVPHGGRGLCTTCAHRARTGAIRRNWRPDNCVNCGRRLHSGKRTQEGTVQHAARGWCMSCYSRKNGGPIRYRFGLSRDQWAAMLIAQSGRCAICGDPMRSPCVDHDHVTSKIRELLCTFCNGAEGMLRGSAASARALADYIERHARKGVA